MNSRVSVLRNICGQADPASQSIDLSKPKSDRVRLPHSRDLASRKDQSTIQYTFAIQQPRPQHLPRGLAQRIFSQPPRLSTSRLPLPHGSPRRSAKNALLYVTRTLPHSRASHHTQRLNRLSLAGLRGLRIPALVYFAAGEWRDAGAARPCIRFFGPSACVGRGGSSFRGSRGLPSS